MIYGQYPRNVAYVEGTLVSNIATILPSRTILRPKGSEILSGTSTHTPHVRARISAYIQLRIHKMKQWEESMLEFLQTGPRSFPAPTHRPTGPPRLGLRS